MFFALYFRKKIKKQRITSNYCKKITSNYSILIDVTGTNSLMLAPLQMIKLTIFIRFASDYIHEKGYQLKKYMLKC